MEKVTILLLRRKPEDLKPEELAALQASFAGKELVFVTRSPANHEAHAQDCRTYQPALVMLPLETPIPNTAMKEGFAHVAIVDGKLQKLVQLTPVFAPF